MRKSKAQAEFQKRAKAEFDARLAAQRAASAREAAPETDPAPESSPAPAALWEKYANGFRRLSHPVTNPEIDKLMLERHGHRLPSGAMIREAEERLRDEMAGQRKNKVPIDQRPDPSETPICTVDAVPLEVVSYSASGKPAIRVCPVCKRTEKQFAEMGVDLTPVVESVRGALNHEGWRKEVLQRRW